MSFPKDYFIKYIKYDTTGFRITKNNVIELFFNGRGRSLFPEIVTFTIDRTTNKITRSALGIMCAQDEVIISEELVNLAMTTIIKKELKG